MLQNELIKIKTDKVDNEKAWIYISRHRMLHKARIKRNIQRPRSMWEIFEWIHTHIPV